jgi:hypothetical protein
MRERVVITHPEGFPKMYVKSGNGFEIRKANNMSRDLIKHYALENKFNYLLNIVVMVSEVGDIIKVHNIHNFNKLLRYQNLFFIMMSVQNLTKLL